MNCFEDVKKNCFPFLKMTAAPMNSAFVFIKPHANKEPVQKYSFLNVKNDRKYNFIFDHQFNDNRACKITF